MTLPLSVVLPREVIDGLLKTANMPPPIEPVATPADPPIKSPWLHGAGVLGAGAVGGATGMAAGALTGKLLDVIYNKGAGKPIPTDYIRVALPLIGAAGGIATKLHDDNQQKELSRALQAHKDQRRRSVPGQ